MTDTPRDPAGQVVRAGTCLSTFAGPLPHARFETVRTYAFEACVHAERGHAYYRVFAGDAYAVVSADRFAELFREAAT